MHTFKSFWHKVCLKLCLFSHLKVHFVRTSKLFVFAKLPHKETQTFTTEQVFTKSHNTKDKLNKHTLSYFFNAK